MEKKDLKIGKKYLLKVDTIKRTWKWVDKAELVEIEEGILTFLSRNGMRPTLYKIKTEEFLSGGKVKPKNCWWLDVWKDEAEYRYGV